MSFFIESVGNTKGCSWVSISGWQIDPMLQSSWLVLRGGQKIMPLPMEAEFSLTYWKVNDGLWHLGPRAQEQGRPPH